MRPGKWQNLRAIIEIVVEYHFTLKEVLTEEAYNMNFKVNQWDLIQKYHDTLADVNLHDLLDNVINDLEKEFNIDLPELRI